MWFEQNKNYFKMNVVILKIKFSFLIIINILISNHYIIIYIYADKNTRPFTDNW